MVSPRTNGEMCSLAIPSDWESHNLMSTYIQHSIIYAFRVLTVCTTGRLIEPFQRGETPTFTAHVQAGLGALADDPYGLLVFSG
jgi:hypothetical protein